MNTQYFNQLDRIGNDTTDDSQRTLSNIRFANYTVSNFTPESTQNNYVQFATQQPSVMFSGVAYGPGVSAKVIDYDSQLLLKTENERPLEKLQLLQRPFATVPYLGKGAFNPVLESQLQQGEIVSDRKSVSTIMDKSFTNYSLYIPDDIMQERVENTAYTVEESAMDGWVRGGASTRDIALKPM
jgi:hypothetical protein